MYICSYISIHTYVNLRKVDFPQKLEVSSILGSLIESQIIFSTISMCYRPDLEYPPKMDVRKAWSLALEPLDRAY